MDLQLGMGSRRSFLKLATLSMASAPLGVFGKAEDSESEYIKGFEVKLPTDTLIQGGLEIGKVEVVVTSVGNGNDARDFELSRIDISANTTMASVRTALQKAANGLPDIDMPLQFSLSVYSFTQPNVEVAPVLHSEVFIGDEYIIRPGMAVGTLGGRDSVRYNMIPSMNIPYSYRRADVSASSPKGLTNQFFLQGLRIQIYFDWINLETGETTTSRQVCDLSVPPTLLRIGYQGAVDAIRRGEGVELSGSGCFVTSVCCHILGLEDDCYVLSELRKLRDEYVMRLPEGDSIDIEYRSIGPVVAESIRAHPRRNHLSRHIYQTYLLPTAKLSALGESERALDLYMAMIRKLEKELI